MKIQNVSSISEAFEALDGKAYTLDGIHGHFKNETFRGETRIAHYPSKKGQQTEEYRRTRAQLGDDWSNDLSQSERLGEIMWECGIRFPREQSRGA
jgi:hypothetical protein